MDMDKVVVTDEALVELIRTKDQEKYAVIVSRYQERLFRYARYLLQDDHKARDVVQAAFIKAFVNLNGFNTQKKFSTWIYRIVHNEAINEIGKNHQVIAMPDNFEAESDENMDDQMIKKNIQNLVNDCFKNLPLLYAEPLSLYYLEDKSYEEISDILRLPIGTVSTRVRRAKIMMKNLCQKNR